MQPCNTRNSLNKHINTRHLCQRTKTNIALATDTHMITDKASCWQRTLTFLNHASIKPPPLRSTTHRRAKALTKVELFAARHNLNQWTLLLASARLIPATNTLTPSTTQATHFGNFSSSSKHSCSCFRHPRNKMTQAAAAPCRHEHDNSEEETSSACAKKHSRREVRSTINDTTILLCNATTLSHSAQVAEDADNCRAANQRTQSCMPTLTRITKDASEETKNLCPERISHLPLHNIWTTTVPPFNQTRKEAS